MYLQMFFSFIKKYKFIFFTYIAMFLIPLIMIIYCITNANLIMKKDAQQYQNSILIQEKEICDNLIKNAKIAVNMSAASSDTRTLSKKADFSAEELFRVSKLSDSLAEIKDGYSYIESIGVYFVSNDSFVTNYKRYAPPVYTYYLNMYNLNVPSLESYTQGYQGHFFINTTKTPYIFIYQNIYDNHSKEKIAIAYAIVSWDAMLNELGIDKTAENQALFLLDAANESLSHSDIDLSLYDIPAVEDLISGRFVESENMIYSGISSDEINVHYCHMMPRTAFYQQINSLMVKYLIASLFIVIVCIALAFYFTHKNGAPINYLLSIVNNSKQNNKDIVLSESFSQLEHALLTLQQDNRALSRQVNSFDEATSETTLMGFLKGIYPNEDWILDFHKQEASISSIQEYQLLIFHFFEIENCKFIKQQKESRESYSLLYFSLQNVIDESLIRQENGEDLGISLVQDNMIVCILPLISSEELSQKALKCVEFFKNVFEIGVNVTVSDPHSLWTELSDAYEEATMISSHSTFWNEDSAITFYHYSVEEHKPEGNELLQLKKKLSNSLLADNYTIAKEIIEEIIHTYFLHDIKYFTYNQCQAYAIISMLIDKLGDLGMENSLRESYTSQFLKCKSIAELQSEITNLFDVILEYRERGNAENEWVNEVKTFIEENYANPKLCVAYIADHFSISAAHIGNRFRKLAGFGLLDYVHTVRVDKCKELLAKGYTIKDCVEVTGYSDIKTLQRAFKKYEGVTPGQYKEQSGY